MKIAPVADVKIHLSRFLHECQEEPVVVTRNGRPAAMLVPVREGDDLERLVLSHSPRFRRLLDRAYQRAAGPRALSHEAFWKTVESSAPKPAQGQRQRKRSRR